MKKIISQISLVLFIIMIGMTSVLITEVNAESIAGLNVGSATEGESFTAALILPSNAFAAQATLTVTYSDGSTDSQVLVYAGEYSANSVTFTAKVAGNAIVRATGINISDENGQALEVNGSKEQGITIASKTPTTATTPDTGSSSGNSGSTTNNGNSNSNTQTETPEKEEPKVVNPTFKDVNETVYAVNGCNVRSSCSTEISSNKIGGLLKGQSVKRTGIEDTWSRIEFNGKTAYVATRLLTTEKPVEEEPENTVSENTTKNEVAENKVANNTIANNTVDNNTVSNEEILNQIEQEIGVLPEVGHNIASILFTVISVLTLIIVMSLKYKSEE